MAADLEALGVRLLVAAVPVKPGIHPERFVRFRPPPDAPLRNPSFAELRRRVEELGIELFDPAALLAAPPSPSYLATDTHWTPEAMDRVARELAVRAERLVPETGATVAYRREELELRATGDLTTMLRLPAWARLYPDERVVIQRVLTPEGRPWEPDRAAPVLLLGDSFTNVYSDPSLGFGTAAGLAEQLSFHLGRPIDRLAANGGAVREALARAPERLEGKRLVVYQFSARQLTGSDWPVIPLGR
jgi:alginate O-acetyltransferase complex protein AlgJ